MLEFGHFQGDSNICVFETLEKYIFRSKPCREKSNHIQCLGGFAKFLNMFL